VTLNSGRQIFPWTIHWLTETEDDGIENTYEADDSILNPSGNGDDAASSDSGVGESDGDGDE
jgi:hypothetical protein